MLFSKCDGMIRFMGHCDTLSAHARTFRGSRSKISFRKIGATKSPPCSAWKFFSSDVTHVQGYRPAKGRLPSPSILACVETVDRVGLRVGRVRLGLSWLDWVIGLGRIRVGVILVWLGSGLGMIRWIFM